MSCVTATDHFKHFPLQVDHKYCLFDLVCCWFPNCPLDETFVENYNARYVHYILEISEAFVKCYLIFSEIV